jgi:anti-anti-sigma factor
VRAADRLAACHIASGNPAAATLVAERAACTSWRRPRLLTSPDGRDTSGRRKPRPSRIKVVAARFVVVLTTVSQLEITVEAGPSGPVVKLSGEADVTTTGQLRDALTAPLSSGVRRLTIDLSALRFADSATINVFIGAHRALKDTGGTLELLHPQPNVAHVLGLLGVDQIGIVRTRNGTGDQPTIP